MLKPDKDFKTALAALPELQKNDLLLRAARKHPEFFSFMATSILRLSTEEDLLFEFRQEVADDLAGQTTQLAKAMARVMKRYTLFAKCVAAKHLRLDLLIEPLRVFFAEHQPFHYAHFPKGGLYALAKVLRKATKDFDRLPPDQKHDYEAELNTLLHQFHTKAGKLPMRFPMPLSVQSAE